MQRSGVSEGISAKAKGDEAAVSWLPLVPLAHRLGLGWETQYNIKITEVKMRVAHGAPPHVVAPRSLGVWITLVIF